MANIDLEKIIGTDEFPATENDVLGLIETIASQRITALRSANRLYDATFDYDVENGKVVQEAVIEMAKSYAYDKDAYSRAPSDPTLHVRYFSDYTERQFEVTVRRDDIRAIIANKGQGVEDVIAQILSTLTSGEGHEDFENVRALIMNEYVPNYATIIGGTPKTIKGAIYAARNMYNHLKSDNSDLTEGAGTAAAFVSSTPADDIRVAITEDLLNLMDVVELANIFNLQKEELFGILIVVPSSDLAAEDKYKIVVYDRKAMGRATFIYDFTQEEVARGRYRNEYLTVSRCYFYNELFKAAQIDCYVAATSAFSELIDIPFNLAVSVTNGSKTTTPDKIKAGTAVEFTVTAGAGFALPSAITVSNAIYTYNSTTGKVTVYNPIGDVTVSVVCAALAPTSIPLDELAAADVITNTDGVLSVAVDVLKPKAEVEAIIYGLLSGVEPVTGTRRKYLFGGSSTYPALSVTASTTDAGAAITLLFGGTGQQVSLFSSANLKGWDLNNIDEDGKIHTNYSSANAVGTLTGADAWNGVIFGKIPAGE